MKAVTHLMSNGGTEAAGLEFIEATLAEKYPHINTNEHIWNQFVSTASEYGVGWHDLIIELVEKVDEIYRKNNIDITEFRIDQIKEKYGGLRVSVRSRIREVHDLIMEYVNKFESVCEECGETGSLYVKNDCLLTLCDTCTEKMRYEKVKEIKDESEE